MIGGFVPDGVYHQMIGGLIPVAVVDDWRRQVWEATTADPSWWPEGDFRGPFVGKELIGAHNALSSTGGMPPAARVLGRLPRAPDVVNESVAALSAPACGAMRNARVGSLLMGTCTRAGGMG